MDNMMNDADDIRKKRIQASLALLLLSVVIVGVVVASPSTSTVAMMSTAKNSSAPSQPAAQPASASVAATGVNGSEAYKDGSYTATGNYFSPGGQESLKVSLTLSDDVVTAADVESGANDPTAISYQTLFIGGYKPFVVGKKISSIKLSNVSGSSLTSQGFNDALKQIEKQAKA